MNVVTSRFGAVEFGTGDLIVFPDGLIGFEELTAWATLREGEIVWLQSIERPETALPCVVPGRFVPDYAPSIAAADLAPLALEPEECPLMLAVLGRAGSDWTLNLRAPVLIRLAARLGRHVVTLNEQSLRHALARPSGMLRKTA